MFVGVVAGVHGSDQVTASGSRAFGRINNDAAVFGCLFAVLHPLVAIVVEAERWGRGGGLFWSIVEYLLEKLLAFFESLVMLRLFTAILALLLKDRSKLIRLLFFQPTERLLLPPFVHLDDLSHCFQGLWSFSGDHKAANLIDPSLNTGAAHSRTMGVGRTILPIMTPRLRGRSRRIGMTVDAAAPNHLHYHGFAIFVFAVGDGEDLARMGILDVWLSVFLEQWVEHDVRIAFGASLARFDWDFESIKFSFLWSERLVTPRQRHRAACHAAQDASAICINATGCILARTRKEMGGDISTSGFAREEEGAKLGIVICGFVARFA
ncbi:hypothetical protein AA313_de0203067 [Arthrobotrys entomopaga]|nr:hypothetical protein AA313_de0203067 [Arthrobotrys entomopaga]